MPLGSQEGETAPQAVEMLKIEGHSDSVSLAELAQELEAFVAESDKAASRDAAAMIASRFLGRLRRPTSQPGVDG